MHRGRRRRRHHPRARAARLRTVHLPARERGGDTLESDSQELYRGEAPGGGLIEAPDYLWSSRLRFLGGTTNHWAGYCAPLDPIDFAVRDWIPHSGWPFGRETLEPWYHRAAELLEIRPFDYEPAQLSDAPLPLDEAGLETALYHLSPPTRFGSRYRPQLAAAQRILLLLHANAVAILTDDTGSAAGGVEAATLVAQHVREDFDGGRVVLVDGWVLAETEARLYTLAALSR